MIVLISEVRRLIIYADGFIADSRKSVTEKDVPVYLLARSKGADVAIFKVLPSYADQHSVTHVRLDQLYAPPADQWTRNIPIWTGGYCAEDVQISGDETGKGTKFQRYLQTYKAALNGREVKKIDFVSHLTALLYILVRNQSQRARSNLNLGRYYVQSNIQTICSCNGCGSQSTTEAQRISRGGA